jgi:hypothetical protein
MVVVHSESNALSRSFDTLFRINHRRPCCPRTVPPLGELWRISDVLSSGPAVAAHWFARLGDAYGSLLLHMPVNFARELA